MNFQSSNYLQINLSNSYTYAEYLDLINTPHFAELIKLDFQSIQTWQAADTFFQEHTQFIHPFTFTGKPITGIELWLNLLERLQQIDTTNYGRVHKGTPYYHAGIYSLFATKYTEAFEWFGYAFEQCIRTGRIPIPGTPSLWMLTFDTREGHAKKGKDYGTTQKLVSEIESVIQNIYLCDSRFMMTSNQLRGIVKSKIIISGSTRALRSAWANTLSIFMSHDNINKFIRIAPHQEEAQLSAHSTLSSLTLILETLIKQIPNYSSFHIRSDVQVGELMRNIIAPTYGYAYTSRTSVISGNIRKDYLTILNDIRTAENNGEDKLAISFSVAQRIRNQSHHMFNEEYISEETFENIYLRLVYCILSVIITFYAYCDPE